MLTLTFALNDSALEVLGGVPFAALGEELDPRLGERLAEGIERRGEMLVWSALSGTGDAASHDLTGWECDHSSFHLEDFVPVAVKLIDHAPLISESDQRVLLCQGVAFAARFAQLVQQLGGPIAVRAVVAVNETNGTFRFHQIRAGESWTSPDLDEYREEKLVVLDTVAS